MAVAHLGIMHRHDAILAHSVLQAHIAIRIGIGIIASVVAGPAARHVLEQQLPQQLRRVNYPLPLPAVSGQPFLSLSGQFQQPVGIGHDLRQ